MTMLVHYPTKKALKESVGTALRYTETSLFGPEYRANGSFVVAHRPRLQGGKGREFFARVTMENGRIKSVS